MLSNKKKSKIYVIKMEIKLNIDLLIQKQVFYIFRFLRYRQLKYDSLNFYKFKKSNLDF